MNRITILRIMCLSLRCRAQHCFSYLKLLPPQMRLALTAASPTSRFSSTFNRRYARHPRLAPLAGPCSTCALPQVRAGESPVPPWMPAALISPPPTIPNVPHPGTVTPMKQCVVAAFSRLTIVDRLWWLACSGPLTYPEDKLRQVWFDRHPEARKIKLKTVYVGEHRSCFLAVVVPWFLR